MADRYLVYGYYTDESQVTVDAVDAANEDEAERKIIHARGGEGSGYTCDGAETITEAKENLKRIAAASEDKMAKDLAALASNYRDDEQEGTV